ncbi:MAG: transglycosylase SLT domain-containing protein [Vicinamibacterales bacterium]
MRPARSGPTTTFGTAIAMGLCLLIAADPGRVEGMDPQTASAEAPPLWIAPAPDAPGADSPMAKAVADLDAGHAEAALAAFAAGARDPVTGGYALLHVAQAQIALERLDDAAFTVGQLLRTRPTGALLEAARWIEADLAREQGAPQDRVRTLQAVLALNPQRASEALLALGRAALETDDRALALAAFKRVYYDFPLTDEARDADVEIGRLVPMRVGSPEDFAKELQRAERLFAARRYTDARKAFQAVRPAAGGDDRARIDLRLAEADFQVGRYTAARTALAAYLKKADAPDRAEAEYYDLSALAKLRRYDSYVAAARRFVDAHAGDPLAIRVLDDLGTHYILQDDDGKAAEVFTEIYRRDPEGPYAARAAWKAGWWAYKNDDYRETIRLFESAPAVHTRSDYKPSWFYWAARSHEHLGEVAAAEAGYRRTIEAYRNSYYGRQAALELERLTAASRPVGASPVSPASLTLPPSVTAAPLPDNAPLIRALLGQGLWGDALAELRALQRAGQGTPVVEATIAYALNRQGQLRPAISAMRRAYPQFMAAGGEALPEEILRIIFPVDYWPIIRERAAERDLDPYLLLALIAQESTFQADVRSAANAYGLMQILPSTGRRYASRLGIQPFRTSRLTDPAVNVRIGTTYFADLLRQFGDPAAALAAYNAGENRVSRWLSERPGIDRDEFIDDIPFPETQNYVKRILGTAEDYRLLYGHLTRQTASGRRP